MLRLDVNPCTFQEHYFQGTFIETTIFWVGFLTREVREVLNADYIVPQFKGQARWIPELLLSIISTPFYLLFSRHLYCSVISDKYRIS